MNEFPELIDFPELTDARTIVAICALPWIMGDTQNGNASYSSKEIEDVLSAVLRIAARLEAAEAEVERLQKALEIEREWTVAFAGDAKAEMDRADTAQAKCSRLRALWERAINADILDDAHELGNAIADASSLLNYPPPEDDNSGQDAARHANEWNSAISDTMSLDFSKA